MMPSIDAGNEIPHFRGRDFFALILGLCFEMASTTVGDGVLPIGHLSKKTYTAFMTWRFRL
jgi:hypothetical protein